MKYCAIKTGILIVALLAAVQAKSQVTENKQMQHPNIVYILCDDLGYADVKVNAPNYCRIATPNIDKLAAEGMRFTDAHSGSSVCTPTRYGLMTGRYAWRTRLQKGVVQADNTPLIAPDRLTVAGFLKQQGYNTAIVGKWHLDYTYHDPITKQRIKPQKTKDKSAGVPVGTLIPDGPVSRGFDYFYGFHHAGSMKSVVENDRIVKEMEPVKMLPALTQKSVEYIHLKAGEAKQGTPFFLYIPLNSPHAPIVPSKEWIGKSGLGSYGDYVMETDWAVGKIIEALETEGLTGNTLVIFTSDNGTSPVAKIPKLEALGHFPEASLRGHKADIWDGGHRVPFIVRWPGKVKPATMNFQLICHTDFMATCADLLNVQLPPNTSEDGVSILPALFEKQIILQREAVVHHSISGKFAIRRNQWKLIFCPGSGGWSEPSDKQATEQGLPNIQLYNMQKDISETTNIEVGHPEIVKELTALMKNYISNGRSTSGEKEQNDVPVDLWKLNNK